MAGTVDVKGDANAFKSQTGDTAVNPYLNSGEWVIDFGGSGTASKAVAAQAGIASSPLVVIGAALVAALAWKRFS